MREKKKSTVRGGEQERERKMEGGVVVESLCI